MKKFILFIAITFFVAEGYSQCTSCTYTYTSGGSTNFNVNSGETLCVNSNLTNPNINGGNGTICIATGVTFQWDNMSGNQGWTINNYGTVNTSMTGGNGTFIVNNNSGATFNFTSSSQISFSENGGQTTQINNNGGTINALNTSLFLMQSNSGISNSSTGEIYISRFENAEANFENNGYFKVNTEFYNHGGLINNGVIQVNTLRVTDKALPMVNGATGDIIVEAGANISGNMTNNGTIDVRGGDLTINKAISGTNGWIRVENGTTSINCGGAYFGTSLSFCDVNTFGNGPDNLCSNPGTYNATVNCIYNNTAGNPFPIKITSFESSIANKGVNLSWKTSDAHNFDKFNVQKSFDAKSFETIGTLDFLADKNTYNFIDQNPRIGQNYYRLQLNDLDGKIKYSKIINQKYDDFAAFLTVVNPVKDNKIEVETNISSPQFELTDLTGRFYPIVGISKSANKYILNAKIASDRIYLLNVIGSNQKMSRKIVLE